MNFEGIKTLNLMEAINEGYKEHFLQSKNILGVSEAPFGKRSNVITKRENLELEGLMKMLSGKMTHRSIQKSKVMLLITKQINKALGYNEIEYNGKRYIKLENGTFIEFKTQKEKEQYIEIFPKQFLRLHSDIYTTFYTIEIKTTSMPMKLWGELAAYNLQQLNTYLGFNHHSFGFLLKMDINFYKSQSTNWNYIWNNYFLLYPFLFDKSLFEYTINRVKDFFNYMNNNTPIEEIPCPEFIFECSGECKNFCPNPIEKTKVDYNEVCEYCKQEIRAGETLITRNNKSYHYTNEKGHAYEECVNACIRDWRCE